MGDATEHSITLDDNALGELTSLEAEVLLDTVDSLRELQVGEIVNLPQIIVVGDQSSGKSSVLEAISGLSFPTKGDVCTRFATELVIRRAPESRIDIRIIGVDPGSSSSRLFERTSFDRETLRQVISEAMDKMGIRLGSSKGFSRDVLRIELTGPDKPSLTLVDLPGFFHSATEDQTREDKEMVEQIAKHWMTQTNSIILAVVAANNNLANQKVADATKEHDPNRDRTLGVITKPDMPAPGSKDEERFIKLAKNEEKRHRLKLGWHVLRNRPEGKEDMTSTRRNEEEDRFFETGAWSVLSPDIVGIAPLQKKLSRTLLAHIRKTLPTLVREIEENLSTRQDTIETLGRPRERVEDLRAYLLDIADKFQRLTRDGAEGRYSNEFFGQLYDGHENRKLRAHLRRLNNAFYVTLVTKGVDRKIQWDDRLQFQEESISWIRNGEGCPEYLKPYLELFDHFPEPRSIYEKELHEELEQLAAANQGSEYPGLPNTNLGPQFFRTQVRPWGKIAKFYLDLVAGAAKAFTVELFAHVIGADEQTTNAILTAYVDVFFDNKLKLLEDKLQEILTPYAEGYGPALDVEFHSMLLSTTIGRDAERVASILEENFPAAFTDRGGRGLTRDQVEQTFKNVERARFSEFGIEKIVDMTETHFQISLGTFAQNVVNLIAQNCLISDLHTILPTSIVARMDEDELKELASESEDVQEKRRTLQYEINILREGLKKCRQSRTPPRRDAYE